MGWLSSEQMETFIDTDKQEYDVSTIGAACVINMLSKIVFLIIALCLWFVSFTFHTITYIKIASIHGQG
jgi:hypothetical protein